MRKLIPIDYTHIIKAIFEDINSSLGNDSRLKYDLILALSNIENILSIHFENIGGKLKTLYSPHNPSASESHHELDHLSQKEIEQNIVKLFDYFDEMLKISHFKQLTPKEVQEAIFLKSADNVRIMKTLDFSKVRVYARGVTTQAIYSGRIPERLAEAFFPKYHARKMKQLRVYRQLVIVASEKDIHELEKERDQELNQRLRTRESSDHAFSTTLIQIAKSYTARFYGLLERKIITKLIQQREDLPKHPTKIYFRYFKDVSKEDLILLLPEAHISLSIFDWFKIITTGGISSLYKGLQFILASELTGLFYALFFTLPFAVVKCIFGIRNVSLVKDRRLDQYLINHLSAKDQPLISYLIDSTKYTAMKVAVLGYYQLLRNLYLNSLEGKSDSLTENQRNFSEDSLSKNGNLIKYCMTEAQLKSGVISFVKERITHRADNFEYDPKDSIRILQKLQIIKTVTSGSEKDYLPLCPKDVYEKTLGSPYKLNELGLCFSAQEDIGEYGSFVETIMFLQAMRGQENLSELYE